MPVSSNNPWPERVACGEQAAQLQRNRWNERLQQMTSDDKPANVTQSRQQLCKA
jgi:hypothetical protein